MTKFQFHTYPKDSIKMVHHTLENGLTLMMSVNKNEPRIFTNIVVRAGSKQDPPNTTGLAHYMEHMLFKGTSKIGTINWEKEKVLLAQISDLYELHRESNNSEEKHKLYLEIDRLSQEAAQYVAPNEYDKLVSSIGARGTNAYTWVDQTVYINDIPSNELEKWFELESERFNMMALRLFHTELETVYEEFNIGQDQDVRKANTAIRKLLFPNHPYGLQTTIGSAQDLKNPSQEKIQWYFKTYYVPNNMAIVASGDFDPESFVALAERYFGNYKSKQLPPFSFEPEQPIESPLFDKVYGQTASYVDITWRFEGAQSQAPWMLSFLSNLLKNDKVGLLDINLNQQQKLLDSDAWYWSYQDYTVFGLYGKPRENQSLKEVESLLLEQVQLVKDGIFEEDLLEAIANDYKLSQIRKFESNKGRVQALTQAFILGINWEHYIQRYERFKQIKKEDITYFAQQHLKNNYLILHKEQGEDPNIIKVDKPPITPIKLNRNNSSPFAQSFFAKKSPQLTPSFVDFDAAIHQSVLSKDLPLHYVPNTENELFNLSFIFEVGRYHDLSIGLAELYLNYVGSTEYSKSALAKAFYKIGVNFEFQCRNEETIISLKGLNANLEKALTLLEHWLLHPDEDQFAMENIVQDIFTQRENLKSDKKVILRNGMANYAKYGIDNPFNFRFSKETLSQIKAQQIVETIAQLNKNRHSIYYYGPSKKEKVEHLLEKYHIPFFKEIKEAPEAKKFFEQNTSNNKIFFLDFPMVQTEILMVSKGTPQFNFSEFLMKDWFNEYFGYGLSSIVFQEIRESKGLAYSAFAYSQSPAKQNKAHYFNAFVGTQPDKLEEALNTFLSLIQHMPVVEDLMENARRSMLKQLESNRVPAKYLFWEYLALKKRGFTQDLRKDLYRRLQLSHVDDLEMYYKKYIKESQFNIMLIGEKKRIDFSALEQIAPIKELTTGVVFGF